MNFSIFYLYLRKTEKNCNKLIKNVLYLCVLHNFITDQKSKYFILKLNYDIFSRKIGAKVNFYI
jgi:hypothetical protein